MALFVYKGASAVKGAEVRLKSIKEAGAEDLKWCDGIALGAPTNFGTEYEVLEETYLYSGEEKLAIIPQGFKFTGIKEDGDWILTELYIEDTATQGYVDKNLLKEVVRETIDEAPDNSYNLQITKLIMLVESGDAASLATLKLAANYSDDAAAKWGLGVCYQKGLIESGGFKEAMEYFRLAAAQGHAEAQRALDGLLASKKTDLEIKQIIALIKTGDSKALVTLKELAKTGDAEAQWGLGWCYANWIGVLQDLKEAKSPSASSASMNSNQFGKTR